MPTKPGFRAEPAKESSAASSSDRTLGSLAGHSEVQGDPFPGSTVKDDRAIEVNASVTSSGYNDFGEAAGHDGVLSGHSVLGPVSLTSSASFSTSSQAGYRTAQTPCSPAPCEVKVQPELMVD